MQKQVDRGVAKGHVVSQHNSIQATGFAPFKLLYGEEAMLPEEIKYESLYTIRQAMDEDEEYSKETIEATRLEVVDNITKYQQQTKKWGDNKVVRKNIQDGDLVLRRKANAANAGKLQPKWECPYIAKIAGRLGSFYLIDAKGKTLVHT
jgi:hypothetical protein